MIHGECLEYPQVSSLKQSFPSTSMETYPFSFNNFELSFIDNEKKSKRSKKKPLTIVPYPRKALKSNRKRSSWCLIRNFVKGINLIRSPEIISIRDIKELDVNIHDEKLSPTIHPMRCIKNGHFLKIDVKEKTEKALDYLRTKEKFFTLLQIGGNHSIEKLKQLFEHDPKKYILEKKNPESLFNKKNVDGETPLYLACKNGHLEVVRLLLEHEANPHVYLEKNEKKIDSILSVAARWNYCELVDFLLKNVEWTTEEMNFALRSLRQRRNEKTKRMIEEILEKRRSCRFLNRILCCLKSF